MPVEYRLSATEAGRLFLRRHGHAGLGRQVGLRAPEGQATPPSHAGCGGSSRPVLRPASVCGPGAARVADPGRQREPPNVAPQGKVPIRQRESLSAQPVGTPAESGRPRGATRLLRRLTAPDTDTVYLVPIDDVGPHTSAYLRVEPAKNNQAKGVRWAMDYEVITKSEWCRC